MISAESRVAGRTTAPTIAFASAPGLGLRALWLFASVALAGSALPPAWDRSRAGQAMRGWLCPAALTNHGNTASSSWPLRTSNGNSVAAVDAPAAPTGVCNHGAVYGLPVRPGCRAPRDCCRLWRGARLASNAGADDAARLGLKLARLRRQVRSATSGSHDRGSGAGL